MSWGEVGEHFIMDDLEDWAEPQECKIGLCKDRWNCENIQTCDAYSEPWCLPYYYDHEGKCLYVCLGQALGEIERNTFEDTAQNLIEEWNAIGFYMPMALQYERKPGQLIVRWNKPGFELAERLPYYFQPFDVDYRCPSLFVNGLLSEAQKKAGYAPAVELNVDEVQGHASRLSIRVSYGTSTRGIAD